MFRPTVEQLEQREVYSVSPTSALIPTAGPTAQIGQASQLLPHVEQGSLGRLSPANLGTNVAVADFNGDGTVFFSSLSERHQRANGALADNAIDSYFCLPEVDDELLGRHTVYAGNINFKSGDASIMLGGSTHNGIIAILVGM